MYVCVCLLKRLLQSTRLYFKGRDDGLNTLLWFMLFMGFQVFFFFIPVIKQSVEELNNSYKIK